MSCNPYKKQGTLTVLKGLISHLEEQSDLRIHCLVMLVLFCLAKIEIHIYTYLCLGRIDVEEGCIKFGNILIQEMTSLGMKLHKLSDV